MIYPGLESHPQQALAQAQMDLGGGVLTFQVAEPAAMAVRMAERFRVIHYAFSLGHQRSICVLIPTAEIQASTYRMEGPALAEYCAWAGDGVFRLSVGLEDVADLQDDLARVFG